VTGRGTTFGEDAELYDAVRPGYPDEVVAAVLDLAGHPTAAEVYAAEVGAGTGKATVAFAGRGLPIVCVEPDPRMARVLRRNVARFPGVRVEQARFEDWRPAGRPFGLLYAAGSWHWLDPGRRWDLVHAALAPGGTFAVLGNPHRVRDPALLADLVALDERYGVTGTNHAMGAASGLEADTPQGDHWVGNQNLGDPRFADRRSLRFRSARHHRTADYVAYLGSVSGYRALPAGPRAELFAAITGVLDHAGGIDLEHLNDVFLARRV
jgi:SAM-dependent methyltransferase